MTILQRLVKKKIKEIVYELDRNYISDKADETVEPGSRDIHYQGSMVGYSLTNVHCNSPFTCTADISAVYMCTAHSGCLIVGSSYRGFVACGPSGHYLPGMN